MDIELNLWIPVARSSYRYYRKTNHVIQSYRPNPVLLSMTTCRGEQYHCDAPIIGKGRMVWERMVSRLLRPTVVGIDVDCYLVGLRLD